MTARRTLLALPVVLMSAALPAADTSAGERRGNGAGADARRDLWPEYAAPDASAAREGRAAMPFTRAQIEALGRLLRDTREATARAAGAPPEARVRRVRIAGSGDGATPTIAVRHGYVTAVSFTDATGAPWPIEDVLVDHRFLPEAVLAEADGGRAAEGSHLLYFAPQGHHLHGNAAIKLRDLAQPLVARLRGGGAHADFRVEIRLGLPGPNADPAALATPEGFHAGDAGLLDLLAGSVPPAATRLFVDGGTRDDRAWRLGGDVLLLTRADLLSPGPLAAERGAGGRWAYRLTETPRALVSRGGREATLSFRTPDRIPVSGEAGDAR